MNPLIQFKATTPPLLIALAFACFGLLPEAQALAPPPDGGYSGNNTAEGTGALNSFVPQARGSGANNTALGYQTLFSDTAGSYNTATGSQALFSNTAGFDNTAIGYQAAFGNLGNFSEGLGSDNTAVGSQALYSNHQGSDNTAVGYRALYSDTGGVAPGIANTAVGSQALRNNTIGAFNIALGSFAGYNLTTGIYNICIGNLGVDTDSHTIRIGDSDFQAATYIAGISGQAASGGVAVYVNSDGKLGTSNSSIRFKDAIKPMDKASEAILALKPVTFHYKKELDPKTIPQFGLVAEDVAKVNPDLVARDAQGKVYTVRYEAVNAMLLNEFLKEHRKVEEQDHKIQEQEATIAQLKSDFRVAVTQLTARLKEQAAQVQKVSAQLELSKPPAQATVNNQ